MSLIHRTSKGFTLIELIISLGLFAVVMLLASGAYLIMVHLNQQAQATAVGINNISFALESMTRAIRTGTNYSCVSPGIQDCGENGSSSFYFTDASGVATKYSVNNPGSTGALTSTVGGVTSALTDSTSVGITFVRFYVFGSPKGDGFQPNVTIVVMGTVSAGAGKTQDFGVEMTAVMRGTDI